MYLPHRSLWEVSFNLHIEGCVKVAGKDPLLVDIVLADRVQQSRELNTWGLHQLDLLKTIAVCNVGWKALGLDIKEYMKKNETKVKHPQISTYKKIR